jgi:hypothetical protein
MQGRIKGDQTEVAAPGPSQVPKEAQAILSQYTFFIILKLVVL